MSDQVIPVVLCVDIEPDDRPPVHGRPGTWDGVPRMLELATSYRDRFAEATGAPAAFSWFLRMDPMVTELHGDPAWAAHHFRADLDRLRAEGDAFGLHPHPFRWDAAGGDWVVDQGDPAWIRHCLEVSFGAFLDGFGEPCRLHRFGDRWMSDDCMDDLERLGVEIDLTSEPGQLGKATLTPEHPATGAVPDYSRAQREPYRPSRRDFRRPADDPADARSLWELPMTAVDMGPSIPPLRRLLRAARYPGRPAYRHLPIWSATEPGLFWRLVESDLPTLRTPFLAFVIRSDAGLRAESRLDVTSKLDALLARTELVGRMRFTTPHGALALLGLAASPAAV